MVLISVSTSVYFKFLFIHLSAFSSTSLTFQFFLVMNHLQNLNLKQRLIFIIVRLLIFFTLPLTFSIIFQHLFAFPNFLIFVDLPSEFFRNFRLCFHFPFTGLHFFNFNLNLLLWHVNLQFANK